MLAENRLQGPVDQRRLPASGYARNTDQRTQRERDIHIPQIIPARPFYRDELSVSFPPLPRNGNLRLSIQVCRSKRVGFQHLAGSSGKDHFPSQTACLRSHIDHIVRIQHHVLVMLD